MTENTFERIMATFQLLLGAGIFMGADITFINHGVTNANHWFPSIMLLLMFIVGTYLFHLSIRDFKKAFKNTKKINRIWKIMLYSR